MQTKRCNKCGEVKPVSEYYKKKWRKCGVRSECKLCTSKMNKKFRQENPEYFKKHYQENLEYYREHKKEYYQENREAISEKNKEYYKDNRKCRLEYSKKYYQENREYCYAKVAEYRAKKAQATPPWLCRDLKKEMEEIYSTCPEGYHVDHIVPIKGETVCGLHVPWNLQHLPAKDNIAKGNRYWPDMWELEYG